MVELIMILYLYHLDVAYTVDRSRLGVPQMRFSWRCHLVRVKIGRLGQRCERVRVKRILTDEVASKVDQPDDAIMKKSLNDITLLGEALGLKQSTQHGKG